MRIARVFPRRTRATPTDDLAFAGDPVRGRPKTGQGAEPGLFPPDVDEVHISAAFTWDLGEADRLARMWELIAPVRIGGPATGQRSEDFTPGLYLKDGYTITSRGCPNRGCWFCDVPKREGPVRELPIRNGWNVLDDNVLATSDAHFEAVCAMLNRQKRRAEFTGGLEAARLTAWHVERLADLRVKHLFLAYDTPDDREPLVAAARLLREPFGPISRRILRCFVLIGFPGDTREGAEKRLRWTLTLGLTPMAMLYRDKSGQVDTSWRKFQRLWARAYLVAARMCMEASDA